MMLLLSTTFTSNVQFLRFSSRSKHSFSVAEKRTMRHLRVSTTSEPEKTQSMPYEPLVYGAEFKKLDEVSLAPRKKIRCTWIYASFCPPRICAKESFHLSLAGYTLNNRRRSVLPIDTEKQLFLHSRQPLLLSVG